MLVYYYRCTNVGFFNSSTSTAPWIAFKGYDGLTRLFFNMSFGFFVPELMATLFQPNPRSEQDNARSHVAKTLRDFCSAQLMQILPWPAYSPDMSSIEHVWDLVGRRLTRDPRPAASKDEFLLRI
ncbi:hypothetical protein TNCV_4936141 [Trichonephila clavipes]|nr:hypothetical protein TNCV_4936141 [Trichonephila clavipes]